MNKFRAYGLVFFSVALLFPSIVSLSHIYTHEKQVVCNDFSDSHFHKENIDCEICKLQVATFFSYEFLNFNLYEPAVIDKNFFNNYYFLSDYQILSFGLRGPPPYISLT